MLEAKTIALVALSLLLLGCSNTPSKIVKKQEPLPQWVQSPPQDNQDTLWGIGIAQNREDAIKLALDELVSKLGVSIQSSYQSYQKSSQYTSYKENSLQLRSDVAKVTLNHYKILKTQKIDTKEFAVLLEVDKKRLSNGLEESLYNKKQTLQQKLSQLQDTTLLHRYYHSKKITKQAQELLSEVMIAYALNPKFQKDSYLLWIQKTQTDIQNLEQKIHFFIDVDQKDKEYALVLQEYLQNEGFHVSNSKDAASIYLQLSLEKKIKSTFEIKIVMHNIELRIVDSDMRSLGAKAYTFKSRAGFGARSFQELIQGETPQEILGITKNL